MHQLLRITGCTAALLLVPQANGQLNQYATQAGLEYFGSGTTPSELSDSSYAAVLSSNSEFGSISGNSGFDWQTVEPDSGDFVYTSAQTIVSFAQANDQLVRCGPVVEYDQLPGWVTGGSWNVATVSGVITTHILNLVGHFEGMCSSWDVVTEAIDDNGNWRQNAFYQYLGQEWVPLAFAAAAVADSSAELYYGDYGIETSGAKQTAVLALVKNLTASTGAPINGVGLYGRFTAGSTPSQSTLVTGLKAFTALGVNVAFTQLQVSLTNSGTPSSSDLQQQATDYASAVSACVSVVNCIGITVAGFDDNYGTDSPFLWDANLNKKPAYTSVLSVLASAAHETLPQSYQPSTTTTTTTTTTTKSTTTTTKTTTTTTTTTPPPQSSSNSIVIITVTVTSTKPSTTTTTTTTKSTTTTPPPVVTVTETETVTSKESTTSSGTVVLVTVTVTETKTTTSAKPTTTSTGGPVLITVTVTSTLGEGPAPTGSVTLYGQCGGTSYTGATACASTYSCESFNPYYYQCITSG